MLAFRLHKTVQEVQGQVTSTEFLLWQEFFNKEVNLFHREDFYFAQLAAEIRRSYVKKPRLVKVKDFIIKYVMSKTSDEVKVDEKTIEANTKKSKRFWLGGLGIKFK